MSASDQFDQPPETPIAELLRLAGHRPQPSPQRAALALAAIDAEWRHTVRRRRRRRSLWRLATAAIVLLLLAPTAWIARRARRAAPPPVSQTLATLLAVSPPLRVATAGTGARAIPAQAPAHGHPPRAGDTLTAGAVLDSGASGRAAFRLTNGATVRLDEQTRVRVDAASRLTLERGAIYVESDSRRDAAPALELRTAQGVVRDIGTQFEVRAGDDDIRIRVREGEVELERRAPVPASGDAGRPPTADGSRGTVADGGGAPAPEAGGVDRDRVVRVTQAEEVRVGARGLLSRRIIPRHGADWAWVASIAPPFPIEGVRLAPLLDWVSREQGWSWRYADAATARHAGTVILHGSIDGLTPSQALDAVLPTCDLSHRLDGAQLIVHLDTR